MAWTHKKIKVVVCIGFLVCGGIVAIITRSARVLTFYPALVNLFFLVLFGHTLFAGPSMVYRFATLKDKSIAISPYRKKIAAYCRNVTLVWCCFFIVNGSIALMSVFGESLGFWALYNGCIAYILMGLLFIGEYIVRKIVQKNMKNDFIPLTKVKLNSRDMDSIVCYQGKYSDGIFKTWKDFAADCTKMRRYLMSQQVDKWILNCEDCYYFYVTFASLLQCRKEILLTANITPEFIKEIRLPGIGFLTDQKAPDSTDIAAIIEGSAVGIEEFPAIDAAETKIHMYTSGSTGHPKAVLQRMKEFEEDNAFIMSKWGDEFYKRIVCSCVNQHHIYGLLFSVVLPFASGVPFRRNRITIPAEFKDLTDTSYMIVAVPAFLKRTIEGETASFGLKSPFIFTSGGVLTPDVAKKTDEIMGFWPVEVYGSTETSGIAWRQSKNGLEWTPFDNAEITQNADGCLIIRSPYISDPAGFETADLVEIFPDGRFLLKGRSDSIVKIEEKRISVTEVENRLNQNPYVKDSCVIAMADRRQYLAAAVVLSAAGVEKFAGTEKFEINQYFRNYLAGFFEAVVLPRKWRYLDAIPQNAMGKRKKDEIKALFEKKIDDIHGISFAIKEQEENKVAVTFAAPESCDFYDGHFPEKKFLPAVAQFHIAVKVAEQYFKMEIPLVETRRIKFSHPILPEKAMVLTITCEGSRLQFSYCDETGKEYSRGTFFAKEMV
ncbi:MAG: AMP-binding protein [Spirochaetia bacterium]|nr:AMP-binding protein [Spirochaetia bacterium]